MDDALRPPGALTVTAVDARTGAGSYEVTVTDGVHLPATRRGVRVVGGRRTAHTARLARPSDPLPTRAPPSGWA